MVKVDKAVVRTHVRYAESGLAEALRITRGSTNVPLVGNDLKKMQLLEAAAQALEAWRFLQ